MAAPRLPDPNPLPLPERLGAQVEDYQVLDCPYRDTVCIHRAIAGGWRGFRCDECALVPPGVSLRSPGVGSAAPATGEVEDGGEELGRVERPQPVPPPAVDPSVLRRIRDERDGFRARLEEVQDELNALRRQVLEATPRVPPEIVTRLEEVEAETAELKTHVRALRRAVLAARRRAHKAESSLSRVRARARVLRREKRLHDAVQADLAALQCVAYQVVEAALEAEAFGRRAGVVSWELLERLREALGEAA